MSNIDERVVKMEFDNKAFEKDASETMSTLDKLKELLKFDNVNKSFGKLTKAANKVDVSNVSDGIETVNAKLSTMQVVGATAISRVTNSLIDFGKNVVGKTFGQVVQGGINRAFNIEQAKFTIEGLGKDFTQLQEDINYAVSGTAYGFDEAAKAASMMAASGIEAGDQMKASLRGISGMAAMTGDSYSNIADIFGNIAGKGKLSLQEVNRFATRGINVAAELAKQMQTTEDVVRDMVSHGEISFQAFAQAMDDAFGEHATAANKTFNGVMDNIKASLSRIGEAFIHPLMATNERDALLIETYKRFDYQLLKTAQDSQKLTENSVKARSAITNFIKQNQKFSLHSSQDVGNLIKGNEKAYIDGIKKVYEIGDASSEELHKMYEKDRKYVLKALKENPEYAQKSSDELAAIFYTDKENFIAAAREIPKYSNLSAKEMDKLYRKYRGFQFNFVTVLQAFKRFLGTVEDGIKGSSALQAFIDLASKASHALSLFFNAAAASFSSLEKAGEFYENTFEVIGKNSHLVEAEKLWKSFAKVVGLTDADLENLLDTFRGIGAIFDIVKDAVSAVFDIFASGSGILRPIISIILAITGTIGRLVQAVADVLWSLHIFENISKVISGVLNGIIFIIKSVVDVIVGIFTKITNNPIFYSIISTFMTIGNSISAIFNVIFDCAKDIARVFLKPFEMMGGVAESTSGIIDSSLQLIADALNMFNLALFDGLTWIIKFIDEFVDFKEILKAGGKLATFLKNGFDFGSLFGGEIIGAGEDLDSFSDSVSKSGGGLLGALTFIADSINNFVKNIDFKKVGNFITNGLKFISDAMLIGVGVIITIFDSIGKALENIDYTGIAAKFGAAIGKLIEALATIIIAIPSFIAGAINELIKSIPSLEDNAIKIGEALGNLLASGVRLVLKFIPVIVGIVWNALKVLLTKLPGIFSEFGTGLAKVFGTTLTGIFTKISDFIKNLSFIDLLRALNLAEGFIVLRELAKLIMALRKTVNLFASMSNMFDGAGQALNGMKKVFEAHYIRSLIISVGLMIGLAYLVSKLDPRALLHGLAAMTIFGSFLVLFVKLMGYAAPGIDSMKQFNKMMKALSLLLISISATMAILSILKPEGLLNAVLALGVVLSELVIAFNFLNGMHLSMAVASSLGSMLLAIAGALAILSLFNFATLMKSAVAIAAVITTIVFAANAVSGPAAAGLAALAGAIAAFGTAVLMVGGGVFLFVSAMQALAMLGQSGGLEGLKNSVQSLADIIPILFKGIGDGLLILAQTLASGATTIADAILQIFQAILTRLLSAADMFATVGVKILLTLLHGILSAIYEIASVVLQIITEFTYAISGHMGEIINSGMELMINFINGMANGLNEHSEAIWAAIKNLVGEIINFLLTGLQMVVKEIPFIGDDIAKGLDTAKGAIESLFGDGTVAKDAEKEMGAAASAVDKETKSAANSSNKNLSAISKGAKKSAKDTKGSYKGVGKSIVKEFKAVGKGADLSKQMPKMGKETINAYQESIKENAKPDAGKKAGEKVAGGMKDADYKGSGIYAATGFVNGASSQDMLTKAYNAGHKLGDKADQGIRAALREKSPSKKTEEAGMFAGTGLVNGMAKMAMKVYRAGANMGSSALDGLRNSMSMLNLDSIDSSPTIRPVLDLSNVKMGVDSINSMFGNSPYALSLAGNMNITSHYDDLQEQNRVQSKNMDKLVSAIADNGLDPDLVYAAVREGAADATLRLNLNGRELSRGLKDLGVKFR